MIEKKNDDDNYVDPSLSKASYYEKLYQIADACGLKASIEVETTALKLSDGSIMQDGLCGFAWVVLPDGRKGFSRWIVKKGLGHNVSGHGVKISAKVDNESLSTASVQSLDRQNAYAHAFSEVLLANGIDSFTSYSID